MGKGCSEGHDYRQMRGDALQASGTPLESRQMHRRIEAVAQESIYLSMLVSQKIFICP